MSLGALGVVYGDIGTSPLYSIQAAFNISPKGHGFPITEPAVYGLPTPGSDLYKLAVHHGGPVIDPEGEFAPDPDAIGRLQRAITQWMPDAELVEIDVCPYDNTADENFIVERIEGIVVGAGTSGHAFKFGPLLGEQLAELVLDDRSGASR